MTSAYHSELRAPRLHSISRTFTILWKAYLGGPFRATRPAALCPKSHPHVLAALAASAEALGPGAAPVANMRVGASDARLYRAADIPSLVIRCTTNEIGAADEYVEVDELLEAAKIHV